MNEEADRVEASTPAVTQSFDAVDQPFNHAAAASVSDLISVRQTPSPSPLVADHVHGAPKTIIY